ncbi:sensor histidine kinase [Carnobacterium maltaromaticum]|uniref:sensor histidine kinase n=1 Tax=Carnobacterium maltaromaticum TaxID=2751 RepID=UPI0039BDC792
MLETEKEKMRSNLLRAISHDLRTPLTGILGASSAILENKDKFDEELKLSSLIKDIKEDSEMAYPHGRKSVVIITPIDEGTMKVKKMPEAVEEIVAGAVRRIRKRFKEQELIVKVPDKFLLVPMDGTLIEQVLINLMGNTIKHSGSKGAISVIVKRNRNKAIFEMTDNGIGIPEKKLASLFDQFGKESDTPIDATRGMGIGLSISRNHCCRS